MLKEDKRYQDLAIKVATKMCKAHLSMHLDKSAAEGLLTLSAVHLTLFPDTDATELRKVLFETFMRAMADYHELIASDDDFMEVLVDELGLSVSDIDFGEAIATFTDEISRLISDVVKSAMEADITRFGGEDENN